MKLTRWLVTLGIVLALSWSFIGCGTSGDDDDDGGGGGGFAIKFNLSSLQGPNKVVIQPEGVITATPSGDFFLTINSDATMANIIELIFAVTDSSGGLLQFIPHPLILDAFQLGIIMGDIAADANVAVANTCNELDDDLAALTGDATCYNIVDCLIDSEQKGSATVRFVANPCIFSNLTGNDSTGKLTVRGKLLKVQKAPGYQNNCVAPNNPNRCTDVKIAAVGDNFGYDNGGGDAAAFTAKSVISGYIYNYDLDAAVAPSIGDLPLFLVANTQIDGLNMALAMALPNGFDGIADAFYGGVIDADGAIYGLYYNAAGTTLTVESLPIQPADGTFCTSVFNDNLDGTWTLDDIASDNCGLTASLTVDENGNVIP